MREVQATCPQCGGNYAYIKPEASDFTSGYIEPSFLNWECPFCGYPNNIWKWAKKVKYNKSR